MTYTYDRRAFTVVANSVGEATFKKLRDGSWGLLVNNGSVSPGDTVLTVTKAGKREQKTVGKVIWSGNGVAITTIADPSASRSTRAPHGYRVPRGKIECEECGEFVTPGTTCWETGMIH